MSAHKAAQPITPFVSVNTSFAVCNAYQDRAPVNLNPFSSSNPINQLISNIVDQQYILHKEATPNRQRANFPSGLLTSTTTRAAGSDSLASAAINRYATLRSHSRHDIAHLDRLLYCSSSEGARKSLAALPTGS